ncbi:uncharacterized protein LOC136034604 isoform X4 [Artemia franciscana]|uniref:uncharacterized protein LOC136034604 isoform X4 n=1 Tax=Artemia franciscana TaxID=6661 RepID=UPI0032DB46F7
MGCNISKKVETPNENTNNDVSEAKAKASVKIKFYEFTFTVSNKFWEKLFDREKFESVSKKLAQLAEQTLANNGDIYIQDTDGSPYKVTATSLDQTTKGLSKVYEISLTHPNNVKQNYFVKIIPINRKSGNESQMPTLEERELMFYRDILPGIYNLIKQKEQHEDIYIPVPKIFYGKSYKGNEQPEEALIVLNDVKTSEEDAESTNQNIEQIVNAIAVYHAAASAYIRTKNILPKEQEWLTTRSDGFLNDLMKVLPNRIKLIRHLGMSDVADKLTILLPYATEIVTIKPNDDENSLQTILFGDLQISNILFKRKDTKASKLISSRWQSIGLGHPSYDLLHYLFVNAPTDFLRSNLSSVIGLYWQTYNATLSKFGYNLEKENSTFKEFAKEWNKNAIYGTILALLTIPLSEAKEEELAEAVSSKNLSVELKETLLKKLEVLKFCNEEGVIDAALKHHCPSALPLTLPEYFWNELFAINGTISVSKKMEQILDGSLKSDGKDGYYIDIDGIEIKVTVDRGSKLGDGYACDTYAITVAHPDGRVNEAFAKLLPQLPSQREFVSSVGIQEREIKIYKYFHSAIRSLIKEHGLEEELQLLVPKMIFTNTGTSASNESSGVEENKEEAILVMENLKKQGFTSVDKRAGVPLPCVKLALSSLAMYHAAASALLRKAGRGKKPEGLEWLFENLKVDGDAFIFQMLPARLQLVRSLGATELANKVEKLIKNPIKLSDYEALGVFGPMETIIHGDFWSNNMMFKLGDNDKPSDFRMIDWQASRVEHPVADISYFILANTTSEFRKSHLKEVLTEYYSKHVSYLSKFGHDLTDYSFEKFMEEYNKNMFKGFLLALIVVPGVMLQPTEVSKIMADINNELEKKDMSSEEKLTLMGDLFNQKLPEVMRQDNIFLQRMKDLISDFEKSGAIDELLKEFDDNLSKSEWERIFATDGKQTICSKFEDILEGKLKTPDKDGYYIKDDCGKDIKVEITRASAPGDNYACVVYSVSATRMNGSKVVGFAKGIPDSPASRMFVEAMLIQDKEVKVYEELLESLRDTIKKKNATDKIHIKTPRLLYGRCDVGSQYVFSLSSKDENNSSSRSTNSGNDEIAQNSSETILVLENLQFNKFRMNDKFAGCDLAHVRVALKALAHYHASTSALMRESTTPPKNLSWLTMEGIDMKMDMGEILKKMLPTRIELLKTLGEGEFACKLEKCLPVIVESFNPLNAGTHGPMEVILHGDFWNNNMLFKYSKDNEPEDIRIVDWQMPRLGHPTADIAYYLFANTTSDFRTEHQATVLKEYFDEYVSSLSLLGHTLGGYHFDLFMKDWRENLIFGTVLALIALPFILMKKEDASEFQEQMESIEMNAADSAEDQFAEAASQMMDSSLSSSMSKNPVIKDRVLGLVRDVQATGILDEAISRLSESKECPFTEEFWETVFTTESDKTISDRLQRIVNGDLKTDDKEYYLVKLENGYEYEVKAEKASAAGDNFMSDVYILDIKGTNGLHKSVFVKVLPSHPSLRGFATASKVHDHEIKTYTEIFPYLRKLLKAAHLDHTIKLAVPDVYYTRLDKPRKDPENGENTSSPNDLESVIVLEDLRQRGFKMNDKRRGCDKHHVRAALTALAHYHATASAFLRKKGYPPRGYEWIKELSFDPTELFTNMFTSRTELLRKLGFNDFADKFEKLIPCVGDLFGFNKAGTHGPMETIAHGDFWNNNMLFLYDENDKVKDIGIVDWQDCRPTTFAYDLSYFLLGNTTSQTRKDHLDNELENYYSTYCKTMLVLGYDLEKEKFNFEVFLKEWEKSLVLGSMLAVMMIPLLLYEKDDTEKALIDNLNPLRDFTSLFSALSSSSGEVTQRLTDVIQYCEPLVDEYLKNMLKN